MPPASSSTARACRSAAPLLLAILSRASAAGCQLFGEVGARCAEECPGLCGAIHEVSREADRLHDICQHHDAFDCAVSKASCVPVLELTASPDLVNVSRALGYDLPQSKAMLSTLCDEWDDSDEVGMFGKILRCTKCGKPCYSYTKETAPRICGSHSRRGHVSISPNCFAWCPEMCGIVGLTPRSFQARICGESSVYESMLGTCPFLYSQCIGVLRAAWGPSSRAPSTVGDMAKFCTSRNTTTATSTTTIMTSTTTTLRDRSGVRRRRATSPSGPHHDVATTTRGSGYGSYSSPTDSPFTSGVARVSASVVAWVTLVAILAILATPEA